MYDAFRTHLHIELAAVADLAVGLPPGCRCTFDIAQPLASSNTSIQVGVTLILGMELFSRYKVEPGQPHFERMFSFPAAFQQPTLSPCFLP